MNDFISDFLDTPFTPAAAKIATYAERCPKCRGTGVFQSYSGRSLGACFTCKGAGELLFKTSPAQRAKGRTNAASAAERKAAETLSEANAWRAANPAEAAWLTSSAARGFEFAVSLDAALDKYGYLTDGQLRAVSSATAKAAARNVERLASATTAPSVNVSVIEAAFAAAGAAGIKSPKLRLGGYKFAPAKAHSANAGSIYVTEDETYLGKISNGRFLKVRACDDAAEAAVVAIASDPKGAAVAYGQRTGECSCCGRELTNAASIALGIGPICAERYGW